MGLRKGIEAVTGLAIVFTLFMLAQGGKDRQRPRAAIIDINQASAEDLQKLPGIGPELARRIIAYRQKHGPFRRVEDLLVIRGIGAKKWKAIRKYLRVGKTEVRSQESEARSQKPEALFLTPSP